MTSTKLAAQIGKLLSARQQQVSCAESCTGGGVSFALTEISGSSAWFERAFITYGNQAKIDLIGVSEQSLQQYGAVSEQVALEMAKGAKRAAKANFALAVTGIAGPTGGSGEKPVGTVCFAWVSQRIEWQQTQIFLGNRQQVREQSIAHSLKQLLAIIQASS